MKKLLRIGDSIYLIFIFPIAMLAIFVMWLICMGDSFKVSRYWPFRWYCSSYHGWQKWVKIAFQNDNGKLSWTYRCPTCKGRWDTPRKLKP